MNASTVRANRANVTDLFAVRAQQFPVDHSARLKSGTSTDYLGPIASGDEGNAVQRKRVARFDPSGNLLPPCIRYRKDRPARPYKVEKDVRQPDGTFRSISESFDTLAAAKKGVKDLDRKIAANLEREPKSLGTTTTLAQFREEVGQRALATGLAKSTFQDYQRAWKIRIEPELGRYRLGHITRNKIEDCIHEWRETAAPLTVCSALSYLSQLLEKACDKELIEKNPMARVKRPKSKHSSHVRERALKPEQQVQLLSLLEDAAPHYRWSVQTLLYTGLRFSEAAALQADDIELSQGFLHVRRAFQNDGTGHLELGPTKGKKMREGRFRMRWSHRFGALS